MLIMQSWGSEGFRLGTYIYVHFLQTDNLHEVNQKSFLIIIISLH